MPLQGRVGRHTKTGGRQCQNWAADQQTVIALLNRIPARDGGAGGSLGGRTISGISSDALYQAISRFEDMHFPGQRSGFVDPGGAMLMRMETLAARTATVPATTPATPSAPRVIQIPSLVRGSSALLVINQLGIQMPSQARSLDPAEVAEAKKTYADSLVYDDIYVSDGIGASGRPFTTALPIGQRWIVALNLGPHAFQTPNSDTPTLIHELAHAWQSQHHPDQPWQYMVNCVKSQAAAAAATALAAANDNTGVRIVRGVVGGPQLPMLNLGKASAYAYVSGRSFGEYGGEQIAQQVEDTLSGGTAGALIIRDHVKSIPARSPDPENIRSLSTVRYEFKNTPYVVWH